MQEQLELNLEKEEREGFVVSELMKHAWAAQLDILKVIIGICDKYNITYFLFWGSLLGAIRHKGFIPWDDDIDIAMKKDDYIKFLEVAPKELPEGYELLNAYTHDTISVYFTRLVNGNTIEYKGKRMEEYHNCPFALGLDVFPLYYLPRNENDKDELIELVKLISGTITLLEKRDELEDGIATEEVLNGYNTEIAENLVILQQITGYEFDGTKALQTHLTVLFDQACRLYDESESDTLVAMPEYLNHNKEFNKRWLRKPVQVPFENMMVNVPNGYDSILRTVFRDYWVRRKWTAAHNYPYYKMQLSQLAGDIEKQDLKDKTTGYSCGDHIFKVDENVNVIYEDAKGFMPENDLNLIYSMADDGNKVKKKIILYRPDVYDFLVKDGVSIEKIKSTLDVFKKQQDVVLWWMPCNIESKSFGFLRNMVPKFVSDYENVLEEYRESGWGILDESGDIQRAINMSDAYYGDDGFIASIYKETGKPMMIQNYDIRYGEE